MFQPQKVLITRSETDRDHQLKQVPGFIMVEPHVGRSLQMFLDSGKMMKTSTVTRVANDGNEIVVETRNSHYRLKRAS
jgi:hypothetical protein